MVREREGGVGDEGGREGGREGEVVTYEPVLLLFVMLRRRDGEWLGDLLPFSPCFTDDITSNHKFLVSA